MTDATRIPPPSRLRRRIILAALAVMILLLLVITPPLLNVNRLQRRIASAMSQSLGRPVHMDRVTLHLLPMPGFTIENLVVSEDPAFGYEPVIRANTVEATLRPSSLWRRQVEFSTIRFIEPSLNLVRNKDARCELQSLLTRAAAGPSAPTAQTKPRPRPRASPTSKPPAPASTSSSPTKNSPSPSPRPTSPSGVHHQINGACASTARPPAPTSPSLTPAPSLSKVPSTARQISRPSPSTST